MTEWGIRERNEGNDGNAGNQGGNERNQRENLRIRVELMNYNCGEGENERKCVHL